MCTNRTKVAKEKAAVRKKVASAEILSACLDRLESRDAVGRILLSSIYTYFNSIESSLCSGRVLVTRSVSRRKGCRTRKCVKEPPLVFSTITDQSLYVME